MRRKVACGTDEVKVTAPAERARHGLNITTLKILHILNELKYSGAEIMLATAGPTFQEEGLESHILSTGANVGEFASALIRAGYRVHHISFAKKPRYFILLYRLIVREKFQVVHCHSERAFFWYALIARCAGVPVVIRTVHGIFLFSGVLRVTRTFERFIARRLLAVKFIAVGPSVAEVEAKTFHNETHLIPNWINGAKFTPGVNPGERIAFRRKFGIPDSSFVIVSVGSCEKIKNHKAILDAMAILTRTSTKIIYLHVGEGDLSHQEIEFARTSRVIQYAKFVGQLENVRESLVTSDIFVMTSHDEGFPVAAVEAMSCGLPLVMYNVLGLRDVVKNGANGFLVDTNPNALAEAIGLLERDGKLRERMGLESRRMVVEIFGAQTSITRLMLLYKGGPQCGGG